MPLNRPALDQLRADARADLAARLTALDPQLRRSLVNTNADVFAGLTHLEYGYIAGLSVLLLPDTATGEFAVRWRNIKKIVQNPAQAAVLSYQFSGVNGAPVPVGTAVTIGDQTYTTLNYVTITSGFATANIVASVPGADGNQDTGAVGALPTAVPNIAANGAVLGTVTEGVDEETDQSANARLLLALQNPAMGGNTTDYEGWVLAVPGVTRCWVFGLPGVVTVLFAVDGAAYGPIPESADIAAVQAALNAHAPVGLTSLTAAAPVANAVNFTINGLTVQTGFTLAAVKTAIQAATAALFQQAGAPGGTVQIEAISDAIARAGGVAGFDLASPSADVVSAPAAIPVNGSFTWG
jgi:uncharacterized phage protein gp47/JayE